MKKICTVLNGKVIRELTHFICFTRYIL